MFTDDFQSVLRSIGTLMFIAELLRAEGARAEPHTLENLVTFGHVTVRTSVRTSVRPYAYALKTKRVALLP